MMDEWMGGWEGAHRDGWAAHLGGVHDLYVRTKEDMVAESTIRVNGSAYECQIKFNLKTID